MGKKNIDIDIAPGPGHPGLVRPLRRRGAPGSGGPAARCGSLGPAPLGAAHHAEPGRRGAGSHGPRGGHVATDAW